MPVDLAVANQSGLVKDYLGDAGFTSDNLPEEPVLIMEVKEDILKKIIEWCEHHKNDPSTKDDDKSDIRSKTLDISEWDQNFMKVDQETLFGIIMGANFMEIKPLLDTGCKTVANMIKGKTPDEIRKTFNITNDFTREEEEQIRKENEWAEDR